MLTAIYRSVVLAAAVMTVLLAGSWLAERYKITPNLGLWSSGADRTQFDRDYLASIPVEGEAKLSIPMPPAFRGNPEWSSQGNETPVVPVYQQALQIVSIGFMSISYRSDRVEYRGGGCTTPTVNILRLDEETRAGVPIYDYRVFLPSYAYVRADEDETLFALVVDEDTNQDSFLSCLDEAKLQIRSLKTGEVKEFHRRFLPIDLTEINLDWSDQKLRFIERHIAGDSVKLKLITVSLEGELVSEEELPDMLSGAKQAFERTKSD